MWRGAAKVRAGAERRERIVAVYQALNARYSSNTTLQWQVPLYVLPVQAALIVGISGAEGSFALVLGAVGVLLGIVGAPVMWRIESVARWDRQALDEFEATLLDPRDAHLRLMHSAHFNARLKEKPLQMGRSRVARFFEQRMLKRVPPSRMISGLLILVGLLSGVMAFQRYYHPPAPTVGKEQNIPRTIPVPRELVKSGTL
jgi:hypothetical protein